MKSLSQIARSGQRLRSPSIPARPDLFDTAREREQASNPAIARLARRHRLTIPVAALIADLSGTGGARNG